MKKLILIPFFIFINIFCFAQFNTITPKSKEKIEVLKDTLSSKSDDVPKKKDKISLKKILKITTKSDLKNEIDSLKSILKKSALNLEKNRQNDRIRDSLIFLRQNKIENENFNKNNRSFSKYDLIDEPEESFKIVMPLKRKIAITSPFGVRKHPIFGNIKMHNGIDIQANYENVYSVLDGIVTETGFDTKGGGNYIKIKHFGRFETSYLHLSEIYYHMGERVNAGFVIAKSGNSGNSTGPHLHFSVKEYGQLINPVIFLNDLIKANNLIAIYNE